MWLTAPFLYLDNQIRHGDVAKMKGIKVKRIKREFRRDWQLWVMALPGIVWAVVFCYVPMYGIQLAFKHFDFMKGLTGGDWAGLQYFMQYFTSPMFGTTMRNTFIIALTSIVVGFPAPIILALAINQLKKGWRRKTLQTMVYMPYFISTVVLVAMINIMCSPNNGIITMLLRSLHIIGENTNILGDTATFVPLYVLSGVWQGCGWGSIIYLAALSSVDVELYDAAKVDGASRWQRVRYVEIPALVPTIIILLILNMGGILSVGFEKTYLMQNSLNLGISEVISTYVYKIGVISNQISFSTAVGLFNNVINFVFLITVNIIAKKKADISLM